MHSSNESLVAVASGVLSGVATSVGSRQLGEILISVGKESMFVEGKVVSSVGMDAVAFSTWFTVMSSICWCWMEGFWQLEMRYERGLLVRVIGVPCVIVWVGLTGVWLFVHDAALVDWSMVLQVREGTGRMGGMW